MCRMTTARQVFELTPSAVPARVLQSPSHYSTPAVPVDLSAISSILISPNRVRTDYSSGSLDVDPVFEVSPDTTCLLRAVVPAAPAAVSLPPSGAESGLPLRLDGTMSYNLGLVDLGSDVPLVTIPIYPLPVEMVLMPVPPGYLFYS